MAQGGRISLFATGSLGDGRGSRPRRKFILVYSHEDKPLIERLVPHLQAVAKYSGSFLWWDKDLDDGSPIHSEIDRAIDQSSLALVMVSSGLLNSSFVSEYELPRILGREAHGLRVVPVLLRRCPWQVCPWLCERKMHTQENQEDQPIGVGTEDEVEAQFIKLSLKVFDWLSVEPNPDPDGDAPAALPLPRASDHESNVLQAKVLLAKDRFRRKGLAFKELLFIDAGRTVLSQEVSREWTGSNTAEGLRVKPCALHFLGHGEVTEHSPEDTMLYYDVFFSHSHADKAAVEILARKFLEEGRSRVPIIYSPQPFPYIAAGATIVIRDRHVIPGEPFEGLEFLSPLFEATRLRELGAALYRVAFSGFSYQRAAEAIDLQRLADVWQPHFRVSPGAVGELRIELGESAEDTFFDIVSRHTRRGSESYTRYDQSLCWPRYETDWVTYEVRRGAEAAAIHQSPKPFRADEPLSLEEEKESFQGTIAFFGPRLCGKTSLLMLMDMVDDELSNGNLDLDGVDARSCGKVMCRGGYGSGGINPREISSLESSHELDLGMVYVTADSTVSLEGLTTPSQVNKAKVHLAHLSFFNPCEAEVLDNHARSTLGRPSLRAWYVPTSAPISVRVSKRFNGNYAWDKEPSRADLRLMATKNYDVLLKEALGSCEECLSCVDTQMAFLVPIDRPLAALRLFLDHWQFPLSPEVEPCGDGVPARRGSEAEEKRTGYDGRTETPYYPYYWAGFSVQGEWQSGTAAARSDQTALGDERKLLLLGCGAGVAALARRFQLSLVQREVEGFLKLHPQGSSPTFDLSQCFYPDRYVPASLACVLLRRPSLDLDQAARRLGTESRFGPISDALGQNLISLDVS